MHRCDWQAERVLGNETGLMMWAVADWGLRYVSLHRRVSAIKTKGITAPSRQPNSILKSHSKSESKSTSRCPWITLQCHQIPSFAVLCLQSVENIQATNFSMHSLEVLRPICTVTRLADDGAGMAVRKSAPTQYCIHLQPFSGWFSQQSGQLQLCSASAVEHFA